MSASLAAPLAGIAPASGAPDGVPDPCRYPWRVYHPLVVPLAGTTPASGTLAGARLIGGIPSGCSPADGPADGCPPRWRHPQRVFYPLSDPLAGSLAGHNLLADPLANSLAGAAFVVVVLFFFFCWFFLLLSLLFLPLFFLFSSFLSPFASLGVPTS